MSGPENEKISVNGEWYEKDDNSPYSNIDHGFILGKADGPQMAHMRQHIMFLLYVEMTPIYMLRLWEMAHFIRSVKIISIKANTVQ